MYKRPQMRPAAKREHPHPTPSCISTHMQATWSALWTSGCPTASTPTRALAITRSMGRTPHWQLLRRPPATFFTRRTHGVCHRWVLSWVLQGLDAHQLPTEAPDQRCGAKDEMRCAFMHLRAIVQTTRSLCTNKHPHTPCKHAWASVRMRALACTHRAHCLPAIAICASRRICVHSSSQPPYG